VARHGRWRWALLLRCGTLIAASITRSDTSFHAMTLTCATPFPCSCWLRKRTRLAFTH